MRKRLLIAVIIIMGLALFSPIWYTLLTRCDATMYAPGYSEAKFRQIDKGMTKTEVERILGKPLTKDPRHVQALPAGGKRWFYACLDSAKIPDDDRVGNTWFRVREVVFDRNGRVEAVHRSTEQFE